MKSISRIISLSVICMAIGQSTLVSASQEKATENNIIGILNTRFGGLFPSDRNIITTDYESKHLQEAITLWNARVQDFASIVKKLSSKYTTELNRLLRVNNDILSALKDHFKANIYPAIPANPNTDKNKLYWKTSELDLSKIDDKKIAMMIAPVPSTSSMVIKDVIKKLKASEPTNAVTKKFESNDTKKARELLMNFTDFLTTLCSKIEKDLQPLKTR